MCSSCKREHARSKTPTSLKKARGTGVEAIKSLTALIGHFSDNICKVLAGDPSEKTPKCHTKAVKLAQQEFWLPIADCLILCNIFKEDIKAADAYTACNGDDIEFHEMWIHGKVNEVKALRATF